MSDFKVFRELSRALRPFTISAASIDEKAWERAGGRWVGLVDLRLPSSPKGRPTAGNLRSFHLAMKPISKVTWPEVEGTLRAFERSGRRRTLRFEAYLGRAWAAELVEDKSEAYLGREGSTEEGAEPTASDPSQDWAYSNIGKTRKERERFWSLAEKHEREPRKIEIRLHPENARYFGRGPLWGLSRKVENAIRTAWKTYESLGPAEQRKFSPKPVEVTKKMAGALLVQVIDYDLSEKGAQLFFSGGGGLKGKPAASPITFHSSGGGRTQIRVEAELPDVLPPSARREIAILFGDLLHRWQLRFTVVVHKPDPHGDPRNKHLHAIFYDRKCRIDPETGEWDFAIFDETGGEGGRDYYPKRQGKVLAVGQRPSALARYPNEKQLPKGCRNFADYLRKAFAGIVNKVLRKHGRNERYDPRKYKKMGIGFTPMTHYGAGASALEKAGVPTKTIVTQAVRRWAELAAHEAKIRDAAKAWNEKIYRELAESLEQEPERPNRSQILALAKRRREIADAMADLEYHHARFRLRRTRALSRAEIVLRIPQWAKPQEVEAATSRIDGAQRHIEAMAEAIRPHRRRLAALLWQGRAWRQERRDIDEEMARCNVDENYRSPLMQPRPRVEEQPEPPEPAQPAPLHISVDLEVMPAPAEPQPVDPLDAVFTKAERDAWWVYKREGGLAFSSANLERDEAARNLFKDPDVAVRAQPRLGAIHAIQEELAVALKTSKTIEFDYAGLTPQSVPEALRPHIETRRTLPHLVRIGEERAEVLYKAQIDALLREVEEEHIRLRRDPRLAYLCDLDTNRLSPAGVKAYGNYAIHKVIHARLGKLMERQTGEIEALVAKIRAEAAVVDANGELAEGWLKANPVAAAWTREPEIEQALEERADANAKPPAQEQERPLAIEPPLSLPPKGRPTPTSPGAIGSGVTPSPSASAKVDLGASAGPVESARPGQGGVESVEQSTAEAGPLTDRPDSATVSKSVAEAHKGLVTRAAAGIGKVEATAGSPAAPVQAEIQSAGSASPPPPSRDDFERHAAVAVQREIARQDDGTITLQLSREEAAVLNHPAFRAEFKARLVGLHNEIQRTLAIIQMAGAEGYIRRNELGRLNVVALPAADRELVKKHRARRIVRAALAKAAPPVPPEEGLSLDVLAAAQAKGITR